MVLVLTGGLVWCGLLIAWRTLLSGNLHYGFLVWNLGLATVPILLSSLMVRFQGKGLRFVLAPLWLVFLPNAPYLITDLKHLRSLDSGPLWLDVLLVSSCAGIGLALGYASLLQVQSLFAKSKRPRLGIMVTMGALFLSAFGIYLGRFERWHSIDLIFNPLPLLTALAAPFIDPMLHSRAWEVTVGYGISLCIGYAIFLALVIPQGNGPRAAKECE